MENGKWKMVKSTVGHNRPLFHLPSSIFHFCGAILLASVSAVGQAPADSWPQFRGSAALLGTSQTTISSTLKVQWTYEAGDAIESSAAIADGVVYVGSANGFLHAVGLNDGKLRWKYKAAEDGIGESSPAVAGSLVFIGDLAGVLHAVNTSTGKAAWTFKTGSEIKSSPVVAGDKVLIGSYDSYLYGLNIKDGTLAWKVHTDGYVHATPAVVDGVAYVTGCDELLRAISVADGKQLFALSSGAYTGASPAISNGRAYYGTYENEVLGVDLKTRRILWHYKHPERNFPFYSSAALVGDTLYLGGRDKLVHALDARTGKSKWTFATRARVDSSPAIVGGRVYIGSSDGKFYVLDAATGTSAFEFEAGEAITASPAVAAGKVVFGTAIGGKLYCLG
jgi:outer membrane protein assembly factor BamB